MGDTVSKKRTDLKNLHMTLILGKQVTNPSFNEFSSNEDIDFFKNM